MKYFKMTKSGVSYYCSTEDLGEFLRLKDLGYKPKKINGKTEFFELSNTNTVNINNEDFADIINDANDNDESDTLDDIVNEALYDE